MACLQPSLHFTKVKNPSDLLPILKLRHPHSCFMHNQVMKCKEFKERLIFYTVGREINENTWIVSDNIRKARKLDKICLFFFKEKLMDYGSHVSISSPAAIVKGEEEIGQEIKDIFSRGEKPIDWDGNLVFVSLVKPVSKMIFDISVNIKGNVTEFHRCSLYYLDIKDSLDLDIKSLEPSLEVRKLDASKQEENFIYSSWKYARAGSDLEIRDCIQANASAGVFLEGKCVSGVIIPGFCLISALYTDKEHRNKGYGQTTMKFAFREFAREGCIPCLTVEQRNLRSIKFHDALGAKFLAVVDWIDVKKLEVD